MSETISTELVSGRATPEQIRFAVEVIRNTPFTPKYDGGASNAVKGWLEQAALRLEDQATKAKAQELLEDIGLRVRDTWYTGGTVADAVVSVLKDYDVKKKG